MKFNRYTFIAVIFSTLSFSACKKDFLDRQPQAQISSDHFFNSEQDLKLYLNSVYNFPGWSIYTQDAATDNAATTGAVEIKNIMVGTPSATSITTGWDWEQLRSLNYFLTHFKKANLSPQLTKHYEGIARFFRAQFYAEKVKRYSDVPWYNTAINVTDNDLLTKARDPRALIVDSILSDYDFAAKNVNENSDAGAVNKWIVKAFQSRFALYEGTFRKYHNELNLAGTVNDFLQIAKSSASDIIQSGQYKLFSTGNPTTDYLHLFDNDNLNGNPEIILTTYGEANLINSGWVEYMFGNYESSPSKDLIQDYLMDDGGFYSAQNNYENFPFVKEFEHRDPRLKQTYAFPGFELLNVSTYSKGGGLYVQQLAKSFTGYHQIKGFINNPDQNVQKNLDVPVIRYAEILLNLAEAKAELGELTQSDLDQSINLLRDRVGMVHLNVNPPIDPIQRNKFPEISGPQANVLLEIRRERRIELALEGYRFDDLMRWDAGKLLENKQEGLYFSGLGKYDLTGDNIPDIILIAQNQSVPAAKEKNALGVDLIYYRVGNIGQDADVFLTHGTSGNVQTSASNGTFQMPKFYYRPIPQTQISLNTNLKQIFGW